jgi:hypothetical protein
MSEIHVPPPLVDNGRSSYIQREKRSTRLSIARNKTTKKKVKKNNSLLEIPDIEIQPSNVNLQVDENLLPSLNFLSAQSSIISFTDVILRGKGDGQEKECIGEALQNIEGLDTLNPLYNQS